MVDGEEMKEDAISYIIDKDEKTAKMKKAGDGEKAIDAAIHFFLTHHLVVGDIGKINISKTRNLLCSRRGRQQNGR